MPSESDRLVAIETKIYPLVEQHRSGGDCEEKRKQFWNGLDELRTAIAVDRETANVRMTRIEVSLEQKGKDMEKLMAILTILIIGAEAFHFFK